MAHRPTPPGSDAAMPRLENIAENVYTHLKAAILSLQLLPGEHVSENALAKQLQVSRTPVRQALYRLQAEGYIQVLFRSGWQVSPFDIAAFEELFDVVRVLEEAAVVRLCDGEQRDSFQQLLYGWLLPPAQRLTDGQQLVRLDEQFHNQLVKAAGNREMATLHQQLAERLHIVRQLDGFDGPRIGCLYEEHGALLRAILKRRTAEAIRLLNIHLSAGKAQVRKITLHRLQTAREQLKSRVSRPGSGPQR